MFNRIWRAFRNDVSLYRELKGNTEFASESWIIIAFSFVISGVLAAIFSLGKGMIVGLVNGLAAASVGFLGYLVLITLSWLIGTKLAKGTGSFTDIRVAMAYAYCIPAILNPIPYVGVIIGLWLLVIASSAIRETLGIGKGLTFFIVIISGMAIVAIFFVIGISFVGLILSGLPELGQIQEAEGTATSAAVPITFQGEGFTLTYPGGWIEMTDAFTKQEMCNQPGIQCILTIAHPSRDGTNINLIRVTLDGEATIEEIDQAFWAQLESGNPGANLESRDIIQVGGKPAVKRVFSKPSTDGSSQNKLMQVYVLHGLTLYQFTGWTSDADAFSQHRAEMEEIINSIQFSP